MAKTIKDVKEKKKMELLRKRNTRGVGIGFKVSDGVVTDEPAIIINVTKKLPKAYLKKGDLVPKTLKGYKTDVIEVGHIKALQVDPKKKHRPAPCGVSIGHKSVTAGTLGCLVKKNGQTFILSNNHVLANSNNAKVGDEIIQPGSYDGGTLNDQLTNLAEFIKIDFGQTEPPPDEDPSPDPPDDDDDGCPIANIFEKVGNFFAKKLGSRYVVRLEKFSLPNYVDAALAGPVEVGGDVLDEIITVGKIAGVLPNLPALLTPLHKFGRTTEYTEDQVLQLHATVNVDYGGGKIGTFDDQILAGPMSAGGDSGSIVLTKDNMVVGLLFAGSTSVTIINPISYVIDALKIGF
jgi:hypothetical protein